MKADYAKRPKELEQQDATLKRLQAEAELEKAALNEFAQGNFSARGHAVPRLLRCYCRFRSVSVWHAVWLGYPDLPGADPCTRTPWLTLTNPYVPGYANTPKTTRDEDTVGRIMMPTLKEGMSTTRKSSVCGVKTDFEYHSFVDASGWTAPLSTPRSPMLRMWSGPWISNSISVSTVKHSRSARSWMNTPANALAD